MESGCEASEKLSPDNGLGSLARLQERLEELQCCAGRYGLVLFASDNGISREGTSRYEPMSSSQIVLSHLNGLAPTAFLLQRINRPEYIVDMGLYDSVYHPNLWSCNIRKGSHSFLEGDALNAREVEQALDCGRLIMQRISEQQFDIIGIGEIGIGDTLCAAAIAAVLTGKYPGDLTGRGSSNDKVIGKKNDIICRALEQRYPQKDVIDILSRFGGLEIAGLTGFILEAAARGIPLMLDGYVTAVAALLASIRDEQVRHYLIAPNLALERGHTLILDRLGIEPVFRLDLNYGEGLASAIGLFMAELACAF